MKRRANKEEGEEEEGKEENGEYPALTLLMTLSTRSRKYIQVHVSFYLSPTPLTPNEDKYM